MKTIKTRIVNPSEEAAYWIRAEECWEIALQALQSGKWSGAAINIIHSVISLADLMCIRYSGKRYAGTSHDQAVDFYATLNLQDEDFRSSSHRFGQIVSIKSQVEYGGKEMRVTDIDHMMKAAQRFRDYVLSKIGRAR